MKDGASDLSRRIADTNLEQNPPGESGDAANLHEKRFGTSDDQLQEIVVFEHPTLTVDDPQYQETVTGLPGVKNVDNRLEVKGERPAENRIHHLDREIVGRRPRHAGAGSTSVPR